MSVSRYLSPEIQERIRKRANYLCEYCHTSEQWQYVKFTIDHIVPVDRGGTNDPENLALACFHCNRKKSNKITAPDPETKLEAPLFDPRRDDWRTHFIWSRDRLYLIGLTSTGRATVNALGINRTRIIEIRAADVEIGRHPPDDDPIGS